MTVFSTDEYYYKTNNQFIDYRVVEILSRVLLITTSRMLIEVGSKNWRRGTYWMCSSLVISVGRRLGPGEK